MESMIDRKFRALQSRTTTSYDPGRDYRPGRTDQETSRQGVTCYNCGRAGHFPPRECREGRCSRARPNDAEKTESGGQQPAETVVAIQPNRASNNANYIRGSIKGRPQMCLFNNGSEVSLVPFFTVEGLDLRPFNLF